MVVRSLSGAGRRLNQAFRGQSTGGKRRRGVVALGILALVGMGVSGITLRASAASPSPQNVTVPTSGSITVPWSGTIPSPSTHPNSSCGAVPLDPTLDTEDINLTVPAGLYAGASSSFVFSINWTPSNPSGAEDVNDEILTLVGPGGEIKSSDGSSTTEQVTVTNLANGTYHVEACGFVNSTAQNYTGKLVITTGASTPPPPTPAPPANAPTFTHEVTVDPQRLAGEPDLAIAADGKQMYTSDPWGFSTTVSFTWKTEDGGAQWDNLHWSCPANPLRPFCSRGGGDTEVQLGSGPGGTISPTDQPQRLTEVDLNGLDTITCAWSADGGRTYSISGGIAPTVSGQVCNIAPQGGPNAPGSDRQWVAIWPKQDQPSGATADKEYMVYDTGETPPGGDAALFSNDAGQTWNAACTTTSGNSCVGGAGAVGSRPGPLIINRATGTLYEFMGLSANGAEVNVSCNAGVTWGHVKIDTGEFGSTTNDFVVGAIDTNGGLYATWAVDNGVGFPTPAGDPTKPWQVMYSHSTDSGGTTLGAGNNGGCSSAVQGGAWSKPVAINGPAGLYPTEPTVAPTNATNVNFAVMPWIAVGTPGRVDIAYYGSTNSLPSDPGTTKETWFLHMSQTLDGQDAVPTFYDTQASETPMHADSICFNGIGCSGTGNRNLSDFFEIQPDPQGRAVIIYVDDNNTAQGPPGGFAGGPLTSSVQQASGTGLYANINGGLISGPTASLAQSGPGFSNEVTDPANDAPTPAHQQAVPTNPSPGPNNDAGDITDLKVTSKNASTLAFTFTVKDMHGNPTSAITNQPVPHTGAMWLVTWHTHNLSSHAPDDFWFASASVDPAGNKAYLAGKPVSVFGSGDPKAFEYASDPADNTAVTGTFNTTNNTVEIDVPLSAIGNAANGDVLYGLAGYTQQLNDSSAAAASLPSPTGLSGSVSIFDTSDQTAPIDAVIGQEPGNNVPEFPVLPLGVGLAGFAASAALIWRRRRRGGHLTTH